MRAMRVGPALAALAFVLASIVSVIASPDYKGYLPQTSTDTSGDNSQSECVRRQRLSPENAQGILQCLLQLSGAAGHQSNADSDGVGESICSLLKVKRDCDKRSVEAAAKCSPSSASIFRSINTFMEEFFCAGKSIDERSAFEDETARCFFNFKRGNLPQEKCKYIEWALFNQTEIWSQNPPEVWTSAQTLFECYNTILRSCGLSSHSLCKTSLAKALSESGCTSSANNQFVYTSVTGLWWALVVTGLSKFL